MDYWLIELFKVIVKDILEKYGPFAALFIFVVIYHDVCQRRAYNKIIKSKDEEIERLVKYRDRLQDVILQKRLTTKEEDDGKS